MSETTPPVSNNQSGQHVVSVVTITRNNAAGLARTLVSVQSQSYAAIEHIVIDGQSTDSTPSVLDAHKEKISQVVSEADSGIYHAMNKGIAKATGQWLIFMNAGDCFDSPESLQAAMAVCTPQTQVIYSDAYFSEVESSEQNQTPEKKQLAVCSHAQMRIIHQAMIYQRGLHDIHGSYLCMPGVTISDYLFFMAIRHYNWTKSPAIIAHCEKDGVSADKGAYYQKLAVDQIAGVRSSFVTAMMLVAYPFYRTLLRPLVRALNPKRI